MTTLLILKYYHNDYVINIKIDGQFMAFTECLRTIISKTSAQQKISLKVKNQEYKYWTGTQKK